VNWTETINQFQGQGSIFWIAAVSMAAGATLLFVSGIVLAKRGLVRGWLATRNPVRLPGRITEVEKVAGTRIDLTDTGYTARPMAAETSAQNVSTEESSELELLHDRLRKAANSLEDIHQALKNQDQFNGISGLKAPLRDVEYVFKTGIG
jgi:hypothetical protein